MNEDEDITDHCGRARLDQLLRRHRGRHRRQQVQRLLGERFSAGWDLVQPPASDPIVARLVAAMRAARAAHRLDPDQGLTAAAFDTAVGRVLEAERKGARVMLAVSDAWTTGVVLAEVDLARSCAGSILDLDRDSLTIADTEVRWGLICQRFEERQGVTYQIESWREDPRG